MKSLPLYAMLLLLGACGPRPATWDRARTVHGPFPLADQLIWIDDASEAAIALDLHQIKPSSYRTPLIAGASFVKRIGEQLVVLGASTRDGQSQRLATLQLLALVDGRLSLKRSFELPAAFDRVAASDDGRFIVAYFATATDQGAVFRNPNQIAVVDLEQAAGAQQPVSFTLRDLPGPPSGVFFSPELRLANDTRSTRRLAVFAASNAISVVDLEQPERQPAGLSLVPFDSTTRVEPQVVLFDPLTGRIVMRAKGASDLYLIALSPTAAKSPLADFALTIERPSAAADVVDVALLVDQAIGRTLIAALTTAPELVVFDTQGALAQRFALDSAAHALRYLPAVDRLLAYSEAGVSDRIFVFEAKAEGKGIAGRPVGRTLGSAVARVAIAPDGKNALIFHDDGGVAVSLLDLGRAQWSEEPLAGRGALTSYDFYDRDYLVAITPRVKQLGLLDLRTRSVGDVPLDFEPISVVALDHDVVVTHSSPTGLITAISGLDAQPRARVISGVLIEGLFDARY
ncbi:MAG: hypothetical protein H6707_15140 [Deltaproteobacteria bacterium]|nr:hypothetical protein [Deltaproteobacteria bacterium]